MADNFQTDENGISFLPQSDVQGFAPNDPQSQGSNKPIKLAKVPQPPQPKASPQQPQPQQDVAPQQPQPIPQTSDNGFQTDENGIQFSPISDEPAQVKKEPNTSAMADFFTKNLQNIQHVPGDFMAGLDAGFQRSITGLIKRGKMADAVPPGHEGYAYDIASNISQFAGDLPAIVPALGVGGLAGGAEGATVGSVIPVLGSAVGAVGLGTIGAMAAANAAPMAIRKMLIDHYEKGDIKDAHEFMTRFLATGWEAIKGTTVGTATALTGGVGKYVAGPIAGLVGELGAMTTVGAAMEGRLKDLKPSDFINGAIVLGGIHAVSSGAGVLPAKLRNIFAATGETPADVVEAANKDVQLKQDLLNPDPNVPEQARPTELQHFSKAEGTISQAEPVSANPDPKANVPEPDQHWNLVPKEESVSETEKSGGEPPETPVRTEAEQRILDTIVDRPDAPEAPFRDKLSKGIDAITTAVKDDLNPIKRLTDIAEDNGELEPSKNPYVLARLYRDVSGKSFRALAHDTFEYDDLNKSTGEGLLPILKDIPDKDVQLFDGYLKSRRFLADEKQRTQGITIDDAKELVNNNPQFEPVAKRLDDYQARLKQYAVDGGILGQSKSDLFDETNKNYAPLYKLLEVDPLTDKRGGGPSLFQKMKGSNKKSISSIQGIFENTEAIIRAVEQNRVMQALVNIPELKSSELIRETTKTEVTKSNEISAKFNGNKFVYEVQPDVAVAIKAMDYQPQFTSLWAKLFAAPFKAAAAGLRVGVTGAVGFAVKHGFRSNIAAEIQSEYGGTYGSHFFNSINALGDVFGHSDDFWKFISSGGANGSMDRVNKFIDGKSWMKDSQGLIEQAKDYTWPKTDDPFIKKAWNAILTPVRLSEALTQISDMAPRLAEFKRGGGTTGDLNTQIKAGFDARNVSVDYMRQGALTKMISFAQPFLNVDMQGTFRAIEGAVKPATVAKALALITLPEIANFMLNKDDERYKNAPLWEHGAFMVVPISHWVKSDAAQAMSMMDSMRRQNPDGSWEINNGPTLRIPRAFTLGAIYGSLPHMILDHFFNSNPRAFDNLRDQIAKSIFPVGPTTMIQPMLEQASNHSFFTGQPLIPDKLEQELPGYQYEPYTSEVAKQVGKLLGHLPKIGPDSAPLESPIVVDNYIRAWGGTLGGYVVNMLDKGMHSVGIGSDKNDPEMKWTELPEVKQFFSHFPSQKAQSIEDFRNNVGELERIQKTVKDLNQQASIPGATSQQIQDLTSQSEGLQKQIDPNIIESIGESYQALMNGGKALKLTKARNDMTAADKRQTMDKITFDMMAAAERGNQIFNKAKH